MDLLKELLGVGILVVVVGVALHLIAVQLMGPHDLNDMKVFIGHLFLIGVVVHLICEYTGVNDWYCKHGVACKAR
jgi:hypothetical protein